MESVLIEDRKKITLHGATKVISSTSTQAVVEINETCAVITGNNIEVIRLNLENKEVVFSGNFISLKYTQKQEKTGLIKRLFK